VGVIYGVHCYGTDNRPFVSLGFVLVPSATSLKNWLVCATSSCNEANSGTAGVGKGSLGTRGHTNTSGTLVGVLGNNYAVVSRGLGNFTIITYFGFYVANNSTLREFAERENISNGNSS
jgi:hypothetical protein